MREPYVNFDERSTAKPVRSIPAPEPQKEPTRTDLQSQIGNAAVENLHQPAEQGRNELTPDLLRYQALFGNSAVSLAADKGLFANAQNDRFGFEDFFNFGFLFDRRLFPESAFETLPPLEERPTDDDAKDEAKSARALPKPQPAKEGEPAISESAAVEGKEKATDLTTVPTIEETGAGGVKPVAQKGDGKEKRRDAEADSGPAVEGEKAALTSETSPQGSPEVVDWETKVTQKTRAIQADGIKSSGVKNVRASGAAAAARAAEERRKQQEGAGDILPKPPVIPDPLLPPTHDPVPVATERVRNASDKKLPNQTMPQLVKTKGNIMPQPPRTGLGAELGTKEQTSYGTEMGNLDAEEKAATESKNRKELNRIKTRRKALEKKFKAEWAEGKAEPLTLVEEPGPPPAVPMTEQTQADIGKVLAALTLMQNTAPKELVDEARRVTFPGEVLTGDEFDNDFGKEGMEIAGKYFTNMIGEIGQAAHLKKEDIDRCVEERKKALEAKEAIVHGGLTDAAEFEKKKVRDLRQGEADEAAGIHEGLQAQLGRTVAEFKTGVDVSVVQEKRKQLVTAVSRKQGQQTGAYERSGERRDKALGQIHGAYLETYKNAVQTERSNYFKEAWKARKNKTKEKADAEAEAETQLAPTVSWLRDELVPSLDDAFRRLKKQSADAVTGFIRGIKDAVTAALELIAEWADDLIGDLGNFWAQMDREKEDWKVQAQESAKAWEAERAGAARDALVQDINAIRMQTTYEEQELARQQKTGAKKLSEQKQKVQQESIENPPGPKDAILTVATQLKDRLAAEERPRISERFEKKITELEPPQWREVDIVAQVVEPGGMSPEKIGKEIRDATDRIGTNEDQIYEALANMGPLHLLGLKLFYRDTYDADVQDVLESELSGAEEDRALGLLKGDRGKAGAATIAYAINPAFPGGGSPSAVMEVLRTTKDPADLRAKFKAEYNFDLDEYLAKSLKGDDLVRAKALLTGDATTRYVTDLKHAVRTEDRKGLEAVYAQIRADVEKEAAKESEDVRSGVAKPGTKELNSQQIEEEVRKRAAKVEAAYNQDFVLTGGIVGTTLRQDIDKNLKGAERDLALALHDSDQTKANAARLKLEDKGGKLKQTFWGWEVTKGDSKAINNLMIANGERIKRDEERDEDIDLWNRRAANAREQQVAYLRGWTPEQIKTLKWDEKAEREKSAKTVKDKTELRKDEFKKTYESAYGSIDVMLDRNITGDQREKSKRLLEQGGLLRPEQKLHYAVVEKDADTVKSIVGTTPEKEMTKLREDWKKSPEGAAWLADHPNDQGDAGFEKFVLSKFDGDNEFDIKLNITGRSDDPSVMLTRMEAKLHRQKTQYLLASGGAYEGMNTFLTGVPPGLGEKDYELRRLEKEVERLRGQVNKLKGLEKGSDEYKRIYRSYERSLDYVDSAVEGHRKAVDRRTDDAAMIVGIVVTAIVIVATGGAATPLLAALAAGAGAAASIITKALMKGGAYIGTKEMWTDIVVGVVDTIVSAATAGLGGKLLKGVRPLAQMAKSAKLAPRLIAHGLAEGAENFIQTIPTSVAQQLMQKGDVSFSETFTGAAIGGGLGGVLGSVGGFKKAGGALSESADILARRGKPQQRLADWKVYQQAFPEKTYKQFLSELDSGILSKQAREQAEREATRKMRRELFEHIPPVQRGQFKDVPIKRVSDADFEQFTRSAKGQAVVLIKDGKPTVLIRESADLKVLREEGVHLLQSVDPRKAHLFRALDEKVLSKWDKLGLDEQLSLYGKKLDIELDGQKRLIKNLEESLAAAGNDPAARKRILSQIDEAKHTLDNLSKRFDEVADITPQKRIDISSGKAPKPDYLDQPARLFSKKAESPAMVEALKKRGLDSDEVTKVLDNAVARSGAKRQLTSALDAVADKVKKLDPPAAKIYLEEVVKVLGSRLDAVDHLGALVRLSAKSTDPVAFIRSAKTLAGAGLDPASRLSGQALSAISKKLSSLKSDAAEKLVKSFAEIVEAYPKKPADISGFIVTAIKHKDPAVFVQKLKSFSEFVGQQLPPLPAGTLGKLGEHLAELTPKKAAAYFDALDDLLRAHPADFERLNGFLHASMLSRDPGAYLGIVKELNGRKASGLLSSESFEMLSRKAVDGSIDIEWLSKTNLFKAKSDRSHALLDFLAFDKNTPWNDFLIASKINPRKMKAAWADPTLRKSLQTMTKTIRGAAGELVVLEKGGLLLKTIGHDLDALLRQEALTGTVSDYIARLKNATKMGLEVKSYSQTFWRNFKKAETVVTDMMAKGKTFDEAYAALNARQKAAYNAVWDMLEKQLPAAASAPGLKAPVLFISDVVKKIGDWDLLEEAMMRHLPPGSKIIKMSEDDIIANSKELRALLKVN